MLLAIGAGDANAKLLSDIDKKERNEKIVKAYRQGYSQYMIAKVL